MRVESFAAAPPGHRLATWFLTFCLFWVAAAASYGGFAAKWSLRDGNSRASIERLLDGEASRPFAFRVLVPWLANALDRQVSDNWKAVLTDKLHAGRSFARATESTDRPYAFRHLVVSYSVFAALLASAWCLRALCREAGASEGAALVGAVALLLVFPYLQTIGGYYYDAWELLAFAAALLLAMRGRIAALLAITLFATLNKETFALFLPALYPMLRLRRGVRISFICLAMALAIATGVNVWVRFHFAGLPGGGAEYHLRANMMNYLLPWKGAYTELEITYGLLGPGGAFFATLLALGLVVRLGWRRMPPHWRRHAALAAAINIPFFIVFCATGELRNLSLLFPVLAVQMSLAFDEFPMGRHRAQAQGELGSLPTAK